MKIDIGFWVAGVIIVTLFCAGPSCALENYKTHYLKGVELKDMGKCEEAIDEFTMALAEEDKEQKHIRFYGMRFGEYYPHREKGICHYALKQYKEAVEELQTSVSQSPTDSAKRYLELAKKWLAKAGASAAEEITLETLKVPEELKNTKQARFENRYAVAVVIGNKDYKNRDIPPVNFAIRDATMVREYLIGTFGYREGNIILEVNATKGTLENIFGTAGNPKGKLYEMITPGKSDVFIYYSGHGAPSIEDKKGYILPADGNPNTIEIGGYSLETLYRNLASMPYKSITVVTDACFSGATLFKKASPVGIVVQNPLVAMKNFSILNSSSGTELSSWYTDKGYGLFTYYFLLGINGKADADGDGKVTMEELEAYLKDNVPYMARKLYDRRQTPTFNVYSKDETLVRYK